MCSQILEYIVSKWKKKYRSLADFFFLLLSYRYDGKKSDMILIKNCLPLAVGKREEIKSRRPWEMPYLSDCNSIASGWHYKWNYIKLMVWEYSATKWLGGLKQLL